MNKELGPTPKPNLYERILDIMADLSNVPKDVTVSMGSNRSYKAVSHDTVAGLLHPLFVKHGVACIPDVMDCKFSSRIVINKYGEAMQYECECKVNVVFVNENDPTQKFSVTSWGFAFDQGDKAYGKAVSYAVKYAMLKTFVLESGDEEESRSNEVRPQIPHSPSQKPVAQKPKFILPDAALMARLTNIFTSNGKSDADAISWAKGKTTEQIKQFIESKE